MRRSLRTVGSRRLAQAGTPPPRRARKPTGCRTRRSRARRSNWALAFPAFSLPCTPHPRCRLAQQLQGPFAPAGGTQLSPVTWGGSPSAPLRVPLVGEVARKEHEEREEPQGLFFCPAGRILRVLATVGAALSLGTSGAGPLPLLLRKAGVADRAQVGR